MRKIRVIKAGTILESETKIKSQPTTTCRTVKEQRMQDQKLRDQWLAEVRTAKMEQEKQDLAILFPVTH